MDRKQLQQHVSRMRQSLFNQGYLDDQFIELEELQDDSNPSFVEEVVTLFYTDSVRLIQNIEKALVNRPVDFDRLDDYMHQLKGSSSSIGGKKVKVECTQFRENCCSGNIDGCNRAFQRLKNEHAILKRKLESYFQVARQAGQSRMSEIGKATT